MQPAEKDGGSLLVMKKIVAVLVRIIPLMMLLQTWTGMEGVKEYERHISYIQKILDEGAKIVLRAAPIVEPPLVGFL